MWLLSQPSKTPTPPSVLQGKSEGEMRNRSYVLYTATKKNHTMRLPIMSYGLPQRTSRRSNVKTANCDAQLMLHGGYRVPPALLSPRATDR